MAKSVDFWVHFRSTNFIFGLLVLKKKLKSFPLIVKHIKKKKKKTLEVFPQKILKSVWGINVILLPTGVC